MSTSFEADLSRALADHADEVTAPPDTVERVLGRARQLRRRRRVVSVSAAALATCAAVLVTTTLVRTPSSAAPPAAPSPSGPARATAPVPHCPGGVPILDTVTTTSFFDVNHPTPPDLDAPGWTVATDGGRPVVTHQGHRTTVPGDTVRLDATAGTKAGLLLSVTLATTSALLLVTPQGRLRTLAQGREIDYLAVAPDRAHVAFLEDSGRSGAVDRVRVLDLASGRETASLTDPFGPGSGAHVRGWGAHGIVLVQPGGFVTWRPGTSAVGHEANLLAFAPDGNAVLIREGDCAYDLDPAHVGSPADDLALARQYVQRNTSVTSLSFVRTTAADIYSAYFTPGQRYLNGNYAEPADEILVVTATGRFPHPMAPPVPGSSPRPEPTSETAQWTVNLSREQTVQGVTISSAEVWDLARLGRPTTVTADQLR